MPSPICARSVMVTVSLTFTGPFHSNVVAPLIAQAPPDAMHEPASGISPDGRLAANSDPASSPWAAPPVFVNFTSTVMTSPGAAQGPASVSLTEGASNFAPLPQTLDGDEVFLGAGVNA